MESVQTMLTERPRLRGRLHLATAILSVAGLMWLVHDAGSPQARVAAWIYGVAATLLYATSATYHVFSRGRFRTVMQRVDHSMIFVLIAGTFTPMALLVLEGRGQAIALAAMWIGATAGICLKVFGFDRFRRLSSAMYIVLGWSALVTLPALVDRPGLLLLIGIGGVLYTVGAVLFALNKPVLSPRWFGYHELWHTFVVAAGGVLYAANMGLIRAG